MLTYFGGFLGILQPYLTSARHTKSINWHIILIWSCFSNGKGINGIIKVVYISSPGAMEFSGMHLYTF